MPYFMPQFRYLPVSARTFDGCQVGGGIMSRHLTHCCQMTLRVAAAFLCTTDNFTKEPDRLDTLKQLQYWLTKRTSGWHQYYLVNPRQWFQYRQMDIVPTATSGWRFTISNELSLKKRSEKMNHIKILMECKVGARMCI